MMSRRRLLGRLLMLAVDALECDVSIPWSQESAFIWGGWEDQDSDAGDDECEETFEKEDVAPVVDLPTFDSPRGNWRESCC